MKNPLIGKTYPTSSSHFGTTPKDSLKQSIFNRISALALPAFKINLKGDKYYEKTFIYFARIGFICLNTEGSKEMRILEVNNLTKIYGKDETEVRALDGVSFSVEQGEFIAIVGPSGSGKSTLLHILGGVDTATGGQVIINGTDISTLDETALAIFRRRQIGLIYQFYNLIPILTVEENLTLPLLLDGRSPDKQQIGTLAQKLGLYNRLSHLPSELSGGQQQRVSIGRALLNNPALLLADEPTGNLDSENSKEIMELLRRFNKEYKQTVIIITHDERIALSADRVIAIQDGRIVRDEVK